ncbi:uncharacterized protein EI97DRAFT_84177 [Westerdykella ornata]|uniref:Uncharacterized protein n=1 Tax=Westerdykella ornata TaxID=318751 RepID=A0A6A6JEG6_WESOR|nr:uncharacterized protein EI97DRAFT_84177 [Westerdykella ornata]KAF2275000.1 hypothetical protein EI97DRAFT_84177 [Westerdykella ornata]
MVPVDSVWAAGAFAFPRWPSHIACLHDFACDHSFGASELSKRQSLILSRFYGLSHSFDAKDAAKFACVKVVVGAVRYLGSSLFSTSGPLFRRQFAPPANDLRTYFELAYSLWRWLSRCFTERNNVRISSRSSGSEGFKRLIPSRGAHLDAVSNRRKEYSELVRSISYRCCEEILKHGTLVLSRLRRMTNPILPSSRHVSSRL